MSKLHASSDEHQWYFKKIAGFLIFFLLVSLCQCQPDLGSDATSKAVNFYSLEYQLSNGKSVSLEDLESVNLRGIVLLHNNSTNGTDHNLIFAGKELADRAKSGASYDQIKLGLVTLDTGLSLPNELFWANLNPTEPNRILDKELANNDVGRIMLDADFQMKKDFARYENPCQYEVGRDYWKLLSKKNAELANTIYSQYPAEIKNASNIQFAAAIRNWIVPGYFYTFDNGKDFFIVNYSLNIKQEPAENYSSFSLINIDPSKLSTKCTQSLNKSAKEYGSYAAALQETMILPLVVKDVNEEKRYSDLRRVYTALAVAQWYKERYQGGIGGLKNLSGSGDISWSPTDLWQDYVSSFNEGEVKCWQTMTWNNSTLTTYNLTYNATYNATSDYNCHLLYNNTTFSRDQEIDTEFNESSNTYTIFKPFVDLGRGSLYESMQESGYSIRSESRIYTVGGVDARDVLEKQKKFDPVGEGVPELLSEKLAIAVTAATDYAISASGQDQTNVKVVIESEQKPAGYLSAPVNRNLLTGWYYALLKSICSKEIGS
jgi:hypothetical protein